MANAQPGAPNAHIHPLTPPPPPVFPPPDDFTGEQYGAPPETTYVLLQSRGPVEATECEDPLLEAVEVTVLWGSTVLHVAHLAPPRPFYVGHGEGVDYLLPPELAPFARAAIVELDGGVRPVAPEGAVLAGDAVCFGDIAFRVTRVTAGKRTPRALGDTRGLGGAFVVSLASVAAFLGAIAYYTPALGASLDDDFDRDRIDAMRVYLNAQAERERERQLEQGDKNAAQEGGGTPGEAARGAEGKMGRPDRPSVHKRMAISGGGELTLSREQALAEARTIGMIGLINTMNGRALPTALWGADVATGPDASDAWGELFGKEPGESGGLGGLRLSGDGQGGGGLGKGIGLETIGAGCNPVCGAGLGRFGIGIGRAGGGHHVTSPHITPAGITDVSGHLPPEVIQRIVRQNYGRFRACYESGLGANPNLTGRVTARFIIDRDGAVSNAANGGSDLPDSKVVSCVLSQFYGISFPAPENGVVRVSYPIMFTPG